MKIFIDGSTRKAVSRMFPVWQDLGHKIVDSRRNANVQLSVVKITNNTLPTLLRLDGVYYDLADNYKSRNTEISRSHQIADAVVYQSKFSKKMCERYLGQRSTPIYDVVYNGVSNWQNFKLHNGINIVACAKWRRPKRLQETIEVFLEYLESYPNSKLHIIGPMSRGAKEIPTKNVIYYGRVSEDRIKEIYTTADLCIHLCKKDSCPSSVVEALSAGVPVVTTNAGGGAAELCMLCEGGYIAEGDYVTTDPDYIYKDAYNKLPDETKTSIVSLMRAIIKTGTKASMSPILSIEHTAKRYLYLMEQIKR